MNRLISSSTYRTFVVRTSYESGGVSSKATRAITIFLYCITIKNQRTNRKRCTCYYTTTSMSPRRTNMNHSIVNVDNDGLVENIIYRLRRRSQWRTRKKTTRSFFRIINEHKRRKSSTRNVVHVFSNSALTVDNVFDVKLRWSKILWSLRLYNMYNIYSANDH